MGTEINTALQGYLCSSGLTNTEVAPLSNKMNKCSAAGANSGYAKCEQSYKGSDVNHLSLGAQSRDCKIRQGPGHVRTHSQEPRERPLSMIATSSAAARSHQRRWSADFCKCGTSPAIVVRKNRKEPQPPQRGVSLQTNTASHPSVKRYSCPLIGAFGSPRQPYSSSSSSSSTSSCSSPPPVQTSVIIGHDPLGWKLRPRSSSTSSHARTKRLSLQIPLPVICPDLKTSPAPNSQSGTTPNSDLSAKTKPPLKPKPSRRRHSDSSAFLRSLATPLPVVTLEELCAVHLRSVTLSDEPDDVFGGGIKEEVGVTSRPRRPTPPPVPEKTSMARQIAQLIADSRRRHQTTEENIYTRVMKPKPKHPHQTVEHSSLHEGKTAGLRVDSSCDRERSTPRFPG